MNILVTGADGFIGSYVCKMLSDENAVVGISTSLNGSSESKKISRKFCKKMLAIDILDYSSIKAVLKDYSIDLVVHLAAKTDIEQSVNLPNEYLCTNTIGTLTLLEAMKAANVSKLVFASSSTVYSKLSPYGISKYAGELLIEMYSNLYSMSAIALRLFSVYGPRMKENKALYKLADSTRSSDNLFTVHGDAAKIARDYVYVEDVAHAFELAVKFIFNQHSAFFEAVDICSGKQQTLLSIMSMLEDALGMPVNYRQANALSYEPISTCGDLAKAAKLLSWKPNTSIQHGIILFIDWWKNQTTSVSI